MLLTVVVDVCSVEAVDRSAVAVLTCSIISYVAVVNDYIRRYSLTS